MQNYKEKLVPILIKIFHTIETGETLSNFFCEATVMWIPRPQKAATKKENYILISLINIDAKVHNEPGGSGSQL